MYIDIVFHRGLSTWLQSLPGSFLGSLVLETCHAGAFHPDILVVLPKEKREEQAPSSNLHKRGISSDGQKIIFSMLTSWLSILQIIVRCTQLQVWDP